MTIMFFKNRNIRRIINKIGGFVRNIVWSCSEDRMYIRKIEEINSIHRNGEGCRKHIQQTEFKKEPRIINSYR